MDVLRGMRVFRLVVSSGSFTAAARSLSITTAWVSKQVSQLEEHLGSQLLHRNTRRISLTDAGRVYLERCEQILDQVDDIEQSLGDLQAAPRGRLRMTVPMSFGLLRIAPLFGSFAERFPEVELDVTFNDRRIDLLDEGFDLAVRIGSRLEDSTLSVRKLAAGRRLLCCSPDYLKRHGSPTQPLDLEAHHCVRYSLHPSPGQWELSGPDGTSHTVRVRGPLQVNNSIAIRDALLAHAGIGLVPDFIVQSELAQGRLVQLLVDFQPSGYGVFAVAPAARYATPKTRAIVDFLAEQLGKATSPVAPSDAAARLPSRAPAASSVARGEH